MPNGIMVLKKGFYFLLNLSFSQEIDFLEKEVSPLHIKI